MGKAQSTSEPRKRGRKPYDPTEYQDKLIPILESGATVKDACDSVGLSTTMFYEWVSELPDFADATKRARAKAKLDCVGQIRLAARENWQAAAWFLERSDPMNWGRRDMLISLGIDPAILKALKQRADSAGVDLADIFEAMINELGNGAEDRASQSEKGGLRASNS